MFICRNIFHIEKYSMVKDGLRIPGSFLQWLTLLLDQCLFMILSNYLWQIGAYMDVLTAFIARYILFYHHVYKSICVHKM